VSLVGTFNRWDPTATPMERTPTGGTWSVVIPLSAGRYEYAFVVDGKHWLPDPSAPLAPVDGLGAPNSVVLVRGSSS
jgi:1,4-alpha-glucan branching enzyme